MELVNEHYPWDSEDDSSNEDGRPNIMMQEDNYIHHTTSRSTNDESSSKFSDDDDDVKNTRRGIIDLLEIYEECFPSTIDDDSTRNNVGDDNNHININNNINNNTDNSKNSGNNGEINNKDIDRFKSKNNEESISDPMELESAENNKNNDIGSFDCSSDENDGEATIINNKKNPKTIARPGGSFDNEDKQQQQQQQEFATDDSASDEKKKRDEDNKKKKQLHPNNSMNSIPDFGDNVNDDNLGIVIVPTDNDVLFGRGGKNNQWVGNERLRNYARSRCFEYENVSKLEKSRISREIVEMVRRIDPPGRFLIGSLDPQGVYTGWKEVEDSVARLKAGQCLRDAVKEINKVIDDDGNDDLMEDNDDGDGDGDGDDDGDDDDDDCSHYNNDYSKMNDEKQQQRHGESRTTATSNQLETEEPSLSPAPTHTHTPVAFGGGGGGGGEPPLSPSRAVATPPEDLPHISIANTSLHELRYNAVGNAAGDDMSFGSNGDEPW